MKTLNLDTEFKPFGNGIKFSCFTFPSGCEKHIQLPEVLDKRLLITTRIKSSGDIMLLLMATDAAKRSGATEIQLFIPYFPYSRQDRQMIKGEPLSLKVFADLINSQGYSKVFIYDAHSETTLALVNNSVGITNHDFVKEVLKDKSNYLIVSPDAGAYKKIFGVCQDINYKDEIIICNKIRDISNGQIKKITVDYNDLKGKDCYIIDDICDGGATFIFLANDGSISYIHHPLIM
ncbi:MAG: ribose-phosphate pyrophosphokinase [Bacteroidetes bacterium]|nr:ribose-phosphate pyrophosphokinase [Bacteroidota bacterium]